MKSVQWKADIERVHSYNLTQEERLFKIYRHVDAPDVIRSLKRAFIAYSFGVCVLTCVYRIYEDIMYDEV